MPHVFIIDDAEDILELAQIGLEVAGWTCTSATTSAQALERLDAAEPDLVLLDYQLGSESGLDLLPRLRARTNAPVVFLTASNEEAQVKQFLQAGAAGVISKPFDPMSLATLAQPYLSAGSS
jgi:two-component system, OmpR family, response regulator